MRRPKNTPPTEVYYAPGYKPQRPRWINPGALSRAAWFVAKVALALFVLIAVILSLRSFGIDLAGGGGQ